MGTIGHIKVIFLLSHQKSLKLFILYLLQKAILMPFKKIKLCIQKK